VFFLDCAPLPRRCPARRCPRLQRIHGCAPVVILSSASPAIGSRDKPVAAAARVSMPGASTGCSLRSRARPGRPSAFGQPGSAMQCINMMSRYFASSSCATARWSVWGSPCPLPRTCSSSVGVARQPPSAPCQHLRHPRIGFRPVEKPDPALVGVPYHPREPSWPSSRCAARYTSRAHPERVTFTPRFPQRHPIGSRFPAAGSASNPPVRQNPAASPASESPAS